PGEPDELSVCPSERRGGARAGPRRPPAGAGWWVVVPHLLGEHESVIGGVGDRVEAFDRGRPPRDDVTGTVAGSKLVLAAFAREDRPQATFAVVGAKRPAVTGL